MSETSDAIVVYVTTPAPEVARQIAGELLDKKLIACANLVSPVQSLYSWQGAVQNESETLMIIKTRRSQFDALCRAVQALHPYQVPEIIAIPIILGSTSYLDWIQDVTS